MTTSAGPGARAPGPGLLNTEPARATDGQTRTTRTQKQAMAMATKKEIEEVRAFLQAHDGEWVDCDECEEECPSLLHRLEDESDCLPYHINSVCKEAGLPGGIEEHGYGDWLATQD